MRTQSWAQKRLGWLTVLIVTATAACGHTTQHPRESLETPRSVYQTSLWLPQGSVIELNATTGTAVASRRRWCSKCRVFNLHCGPFTASVRTQTAFRTGALVSTQHSIGISMLFSNIVSDW